MRRAVFFLPYFLLLAGVAAAQASAPACRALYEVGTFDSPRVDFSPDGNAFMVHDWSNNEIRFIGAYHVATGRSLRTPGGRKASFQGDRWIKVDGRLHDRSSGARDPLPPGVRDVRYQGRYAVLYEEAGAVRVARANDLTTIVQFTDYDVVDVNEELGIAFAYRPISSSKGGLPDVLIWDLATAKQVARLTARRIEYVKVLGAYLLIYEPEQGGKRALTVWDPRSGRQIGRYEARAVLWHSRNAPGPVLSDGTRYAAVVHMEQPDRLIEADAKGGPCCPRWVAKNRIYNRSHSAGGSVAVILDRDARTVLATMPGATSVLGLDNDLIGVQYGDMPQRSPRVDILDAESLQVVASIPGEKIATGLWDEADGRFVTVYSDAAKGRAPVTLFDTAQRAVVCATPETAPGKSMVFPAPGGRYLAVAWSTDEPRAGERPRSDFRRMRLVVYAAPDAEADKRRIAEMVARSQRLTDAERNRARALFKQAFELFQAGEFAAAVLGFQKGLDIDPANGLAHFYLAETYARQNKTALARQHWQHTIDFAPDSKEALIAQSRLNRQGIGGPELNRPEPSARTDGAGRQTSGASEQEELEEAISLILGMENTKSRRDGQKREIGPPACALDIGGTFMTHARANDPYSVTATGTDVWQTRGGKTTFTSTGETTTSGEVIGVRGEDLIVRYVSTYLGRRYPGTGTVRFDRTCSGFTGTWQSESSSGTWWGSRVDSAQAVR